MAFDMPYSRTLERIAAALESIAYYLDRLDTGQDDLISIAEQFTGKKSNAGEDETPNVAVEDTQAFSL